MATIFGSVAVWLMLVGTSLQLSELSLKDCEEVVLVDGTFAGAVFYQETIQNASESLNYTKTHAQSMILFNYQDSRKNLENCSELDDYLSKLDDTLGTCSLNFLNHTQLKNDIDGDLVSVTSNAEQLLQDCKTPWDRLRSPIDCSRFGYVGRIKAACTKLIQKIGLLNVKLYQDLSLADRCFDGTIEKAVKEIEGIVKKCLI